MTQSSIFDQLWAILPDDFSRTLLDGALEVLQSANPLRAHLYATAMRELLGHTLHTKAPDASVQACSWYIAEGARPTRRQRATFAIQGGMPNAVVDSLGLDASDMQKELTSAVAELNKRTHLRPGTLLNDPQQIAEFAVDTAAAIFEFLTMIADMRTSVAQSLLHTVSNDVFSKFLEETVSEIDILSTHSQVESVDVEQIEVAQIGVDSIAYDAEGTVYVTLVFGSGSDQEKGDGATIAESFPFSCTLQGSVKRLQEISEVSDLDVDTSSWVRVTRFPRRQESGLAAIRINRKGHWHDGATCAMRHPTTLFDTHTKCQIKHRTTS